MSKPRVALYIRVSSADQNPDLQHRELQEYVQHRSWTITEVYEDRLSGTNTNRKQLQGMMRDARARKFDICLVWKLDRAFRSLKDCVNFLQEMGDLGVQFVSLKDSGIDMTLPSGRLLMHLLAAFAEFEASICRTRVMSGLAAAKARGVKLGRPNLLLPQLEGQIVALREQGLSMRQIERKLENKVSRSSIHRVLKMQSPATVSKLSHSPSKIPAVTD